VRRNTSAHYHQGKKIKAKGIYRDPVRSSHGHLVKVSGWRWLTMMLLVEIPLLEWFVRRWLSRSDL
jgi:hypothetical protein